MDKLPKSVEFMLSKSKAKEIYLENAVNINNFDHKRMGPLLAMYANAIAAYVEVQEQLDSGVVNDYANKKAWADLQVLHSKRIIEAGKNLRMFDLQEGDEEKEFASLTGEDESSTKGEDAE